MDGFSEKGIIYNLTEGILYLTKEMILNLSPFEIKALQSKILVIGCLIISLLIIKQVGSYGIAALLLSSAEKKKSIALADQALNIFPGSADFYKKRGNIFLALEFPEQAVSDFEHSVQLTPNDYWAWLQLGDAREQINDNEKAIEAYQKSIALNPFYGLPRWYLGQAFFKTGQTEAGWKELRAAYQNDVEFLPAAINFAWGWTRGKPELIEKHLELKTPTSKLILGGFLLEQGATAEASSYICNTNELTDNERKIFVSRLFEQGKFRLAYSAESGKCFNPSELSDFSTEIRNGGFESALATNNGSFEWQFSTNEKNVQLARDSGQHPEGAFSLKVDFSGNADPGLNILKQLVLVEPATTYKLSYQTQTKDLLTDCQPQFNIIESPSKEVLLVTSEGFSERPDLTWRTYQSTFETKNDTEAIWIVLKRENSRYNQCPILGSIWLEDISLQKIKYKEEKIK